MPHSVTLLGGNEDKPFESYYVDVDLFLSTNHSYVDIDMNKIREENNLNDIGSNCDGIASEAMRISKLLELKYQKKSRVKGIHLSKADLKKKDYGYVPEDDFIDDEEDFDELIPFHLDTALGGCYVNEGPSELKAVIEIDAEEAMLEEDDSDVDKSEDELIALDKQSIAEKPISESSADEVHIEEEESIKKRKAATPPPDLSKKTKYTTPEIVSTENTTQSMSQNTNKTTTPFNTNMNRQLMENLNSLLVLVKEKVDPSKKFRVNDEMMGLFDEIIKTCEKENFKNRDINRMYQYVADHMNIHTANLKEKLKTFRSNGTLGCNTTLNGNLEIQDVSKTTDNGTQEKIRTESQQKVTSSQDSTSSSNRIEAGDILIKHIKNLVSDDIERKVRAEVTASVKASDNKRDNLIWSSTLNNYVQQFLKLFTESISNEPSITANMVVDTFKKAIYDILYPYFSECGNTQHDFQLKMKPHIETYHSEINTIVNKKQQNGIGNCSGKQSPATNLPKQKKDQPKQSTEQTTVPTKSSKTVVDKNKQIDVEKQIKTLIISGNSSQLEIAEVMLNDNSLQGYISKEAIGTLRSLLQVRKQSLKQNTSLSKNTSSAPQKNPTTSTNSSSSTNGTPKSSSGRVSNNTNNVQVSNSKQPSLNVAHNVIAQSMKQAVNQQQYLQQQQNIVSSLATLISQNQNRLPQNLMQLRNFGLSEAQLSAFINNPNQQFFAELIKQATRNRQ
uniref:HUN domain-containing protein n=1 Tax=Strongyloides stercoralis TaxID=6248 RepID=A0A0K0EKV8_STRER